MRRRVPKCCIWPVVLYRCESWTLTAALIKNLEAVEMWFYQKMQRISYMAKKTNKQVLIQVNQSRSLLKIMKKRKFQFLDTLSGHNNYNIWLFVEKFVARTHEDVQEKCTWTSLRSS